MTDAPQNRAPSPRRTGRRRRQPLRQQQPAGTAGATPARVRVTLSLDAASVAWAQEQPGGLAELVRRLLAEARSADQEPGPHAHAEPVGEVPGGGGGDDAELRAAFTRLIDRKLRHGLAEAEELVLADLRARLNGHGNDEIADVRATLTDLSHLQQRK